MLADGEIVGDGSWNLTIYVTDMNVERKMVVKSDMHIGGVMLKLTESFGKCGTSLFCLLFMQYCVKEDGFLVIFL